MSEKQKPNTATDEFAANLTAFALGELPAGEAARLAPQIAGEPELAREVAEIQRLAAVLRPDSDGVDDTAHASWQASPTGAVAARAATRAAVLAALDAPRASSTAALPDSYRSLGSPTPAGLSWSAAAGKIPRRRLDRRGWIALLSTAALLLCGLFLWDKLGSVSQIAMQAPAPTSSPQATRESANALDRLELSEPPRSEMPPSAAVAATGGDQSDEALAPLAGNAGGKELRSAGLGGGAGQGGAGQGGGGGGEEGLGRQATGAGGLAARASLLPPGNPQPPVNAATLADQAVAPKRDPGEGGVTGQLTQAMREERQDAAAGADQATDNAPPALVVENRPQQNEPGQSELAASQRAEALSRSGSRSDTEQGRAEQLAAAERPSSPTEPSAGMPSGSGAPAERKQSSDASGDSAAPLSRSADSAEFDSGKRQMAQTDALPAAPAGDRSRQNLDAEMRSAPGELAESAGSLGLADALRPAAKSASQPAGAAADKKSGTPEPLGRSQRFADNENLMHFGQPQGKSAEAAGRDAPAAPPESPFFRAQGARVLSAIPLGVDPASYPNVRESLRAGAWPAVDVVQTAALLNHFPYAYAPPATDRPVAATLQLFACPWAADHVLLRVGIQARLVASDKPATVAENVKIQVEFNPAHVAAYRLLGYDTPAVNPGESMESSDVVAEQLAGGAFAADQQLTALYEIIPASRDLAAAKPQAGELANSPPAAESNASGAPQVPAAQADRLATVALHYRLPGLETDAGEEFFISPTPLPFSQADADSRFATAVAAFALRLRNEPQVTALAWEEIAQIADAARAADPQGLRSEFSELVRLAAQQSAPPTAAPAPAAGGGGD